MNTLFSSINMEKSSPFSFNEDPDFESTLIFQLNDDCLAEVFGYLSLKDIVNLIHTDERFRSAARIRFSSGGVNLIDKDFLKDFPPDIREDFYKAYGTRASEMRFAFLANSDFSNAIRHFQKLTKLVLAQIGISVEDGVDNLELPGSLKSLVMAYCNIPAHVLQKWFRQINATLSTFAIFYESQTDSEPTTYDWANELTNLTRLIVTNHGDVNFIGKVIGQNKNSLRGLALFSTFEESKPLPIHVWNIVSELHQLTQLVLKHYDIGEGIRLRPSNLWPELTILMLTINDPSPIIASLGCQLSLHTLYLTSIDLSPTFDLLPLRFFPNLRTLSLSNVDWMGLNRSNDLSQVVALQQVDDLSLDGGVFSHSRVVVDMVVRMPNLKKLSLEEVLFIIEWEMMDEDELEMEVREALEKENPLLEIQISIRNDDD